MKLLRVVNEEEWTRNLRELETCFLKSKNQKHLEKSGISLLVITKDVTNII